MCPLVAKCLDFLVDLAYFYFDAIAVRGTAGMVSGLEFVEAVSWLRVWSTVGKGPSARRAVAGGDPVGARETLVADDNDVS